MLTHEHIKVPSKVKKAEIAAMPLFVDAKGRSHFNVFECLLWGHGITRAYRNGNEQ
jgi:hypothetical protein